VVISNLLEGILPGHVHKGGDGLEGEEERGEKCVPGGDTEAIKVKGKAKEFVNSTMGGKERWEELRPRGRICCANWCEPFEMKIE
jgi:hypothetical protein